jgi:hypothetical protein
VTAIFGRERCVVSDICHEGQDAIVRR